MTTQANVAVVLETDVPCRKCSYNLRGLPTEGRCPECGTPVGLSVQGDFAIMYLLLIEKMGKCFKEQAAYARQTWAVGMGQAAGA